MKRRFTLFILLMTTIGFIFSGCQQTTEEQVANDIIAQEHDRAKMVTPPSNTKVQQQQQNTLEDYVTEYADHFGYYLMEAAHELEALAPFYRGGQTVRMNEPEARERLRELHAWTKSMLVKDTPSEFQGVRNVLESLEIELNTVTNLHDELVSNPTSGNRARTKVHFENAVSNLKQVERAYLTVLDNEGLY
ncbi:hypothetical protein P4637_01155 [Halalkalibacterium halodurans]|uniref:BH1745 protein n=1 Tax=Halalkalibacterium halodurans (strain ATCC BAA-125 / DSM 18197 / FERM 7344 / JCM 9153 / C-125) TaxID=272558 RepID=Q9KC29_HALH5|nr:hypothetical protein [Halalkalibacterium halodurans]MED4082383.1 hypothetical protein [Halalkalibacterium halodurans]MED4083466.1 hypothetical protein [Halalkalibacterium halodurans]MED4105779.1 hypothetical protein [Halalkalibacterium halodurans]MED4109891.1 hypothetical protein [Halalkalibacterium halodurans]MED4149232.1 hypothetical protein [Halalkalibacterium halodurans]